MPECPKCRANLPEGTEFCPNDGESLEKDGFDIGVAATALGPSDLHDTAASPKGRDSVGTSSLLGETVGGVYKVVELIGVGGMGEVYRVTHENLKKEFALKVLGQIAQEHPDAVERFRQEAIAASHIEHDNIVDIITLDSTDDGNLYLVMELLKGKSLADAIESDSPMPPERALPIIYQICRALHAAHEEGIIHRDLKPENVYLTPKGDAEFVKILDFGISKIHDAENKRVRITKTGHVLGTPLYMSPEQAKGEATLDRRVDIYSLAVIFFEMLEGNPPFKGENYFQLIWKHSNETAPPMEGDAPDALKEVILRALSKEPEDRYEDMLVFEEAIIDSMPSIQPPSFLLDFRPTGISRFSTDPVAPPKTNRWGTYAAIAASILAVVAIAYGVTRGGEESDLGEDVSSGNTSGAQLPEAGMVDAGIALLEEAGAPDSGDDDEVTVTKLITFSVVSRPLGAKVYIDDEMLGVTPLEIEREPANSLVEIKLAKPGFLVQRKRVLLDEDFSLMVPLVRKSTSPSAGDEKIFIKNY